MKTLFLAWQDANTGDWFPIGKLTYDGKMYEFAYTKGILAAIEKCGFEPLYSLPDLNKLYRSVELFPLFSNRVLSRSRPNYKNFVELLNLPQYEDDPITLLARSGGQKATDKFEVFPCPERDENGLYHVHFFVRGLRHLPPASLDRINKLQKNELLRLVHDFQNPYDRKALMLRTNETFLGDLYPVGYCPRYLVDDAFNFIGQNPELVHIQVERVNPAPTPLQFRLLCNMTAPWPDNFHPFSSSMYQPLRADIATGTRAN
ncbi:HIRAN domain-containing protein [Planktothrix sp. FACHB-1355]|uniref:HIRAN domain-containing protein n=1 Tax=Aerosakkonema funiforme FACHB-1375 TaxID=2949571 RepID=A0A926ZF95_9CYAN|nr:MULTISPECIES: HIRAN domain-containing protein [Oscillatoriales]MBD2180459.1 HIRAN domain-containing protein [Aerosakkonema funiforme FACHB-1375]MBD3560282.1 HIRAN domain-containing protein [Planktothrix sp. FACHB-1355]